jgi:hypothetical protein
MSTIAGLLSALQQFLEELKELIDSLKRLLMAGAII